MKCRHCNTDLEISFLDLGSAPPSNAYLTENNLHEAEIWLPLRVLVCRQCWLVQTEDFARSEQLFTDEYAYFSSYSTTWLAHAKAYVEDMIKRFKLGRNHLVVEVAANDGYLLQYVKDANIPCYGIEPTKGTAAAATEKGIPIIERFFGTELAKELSDKGRQADLMTANNVLAHVPNTNDFVTGFTILLKPQGVVTFEFPSLIELVTENQFDTIYHEHYSYFSLTSVKNILETNGLSVFDVEKLSTHGGSLRVFAQQADTGIHPVSGTVLEYLKKEASLGITEQHFYSGFQARAEKIKDDLLTFLLECKHKNKTVAAYGAAAKGNTLLNFAGVRPDLLSYVVDRNPAKQGRFLPGSRIPILEENVLHVEKPDFVIVLPWNIKEEIMQQLNYIRDWKGQFVTAIPDMNIM